MRHSLVLLAVALWSLPAFASNPGEPLDCSDWVFLEPGLSCLPVIAKCDSGLGSNLLRWCYRGQATVASNDFGLLTVVPTEIDPPIQCGTNMFARERVEIQSFESGVLQTIAYIQDRCTPDGRVDEIAEHGPHYSGNAKQHSYTTFDPLSGRLYLTLESECDENATTLPCDYRQIYWLAAIDGFTTTFEVLQTYTPTSGPISFRVPYMPEGFPAADYFDTYYGDLATVGDWSKAQPLKCGYPASAPAVGDYLTVEDTLPALEPGQGRYYVTAVIHQGQRRYGRKSSGAVMTGRDPGLLPTCSE